MRMPDPMYRGKYVGKPHYSGPNMDYKALGRVHATMPLTIEQYAAVKDEAKAAGTTVGRYLAGIVVPQLKLKKKKD